jgi:purine-nucleoside phosphorylase
MLSLTQQTAQAAGEIVGRWNCRPKVGIILGTGLGSFAQQIQAESVIGYDEIPHFMRSTAVGHKGQLVCGQVAGVPIVAMEGRFHLYEGYSLAQITFPVRVLKAIGVELLIISNASGGLRPYHRPGDILVIDDHINLMMANPLVGAFDEQLQRRFPDLSRPYDPQLIDRALAIARRVDFAAYQGVYVAVCGPNYETRAEYRFLRKIGGDVVGMSTVPEVIVAKDVGLRVLALSVITNVCRPDALPTTDGDSVVAAAREAEFKLRKIVLGVLAEEHESLHGLVVESNALGEGAASALANSTESSAGESRT